MEVTTNGLRNIKVMTLLFAAALLFHQCHKDPIVEITPPNYVQDVSGGPTPYNLVIPSGFPNMDIPQNNSMTVEGISLGRMLFYDPILSGDNTQSCAGCHAQAFAFSDNGKQFSTGIDGIEGGRNAPAITNPGWLPNFFWDGRAGSLEEQALGPVPNPIEMHLEWPDAVNKLNSHNLYPGLFSKAFGSEPISKELVAKAIAQFERTFISSDSKWDQYLRGEYVLTQAEAKGFDIFFTEKGDCFHCHGTILFTDNLFHNNGLDSTFIDLGLGTISGNPNENGAFRSPTLRNIEFTAPYMHDGRFASLEEVVEFYSEGVRWSSTVDPLMKKVGQGGLQLSQSEKQELVAYLRTLSDPTFISNPDFATPF